MNTAETFCKIWGFLPPVNYIHNYYCCDFYYKGCEVKIQGIETLDEILNKISERLNTFFE